MERRHIRLLLVEDNPDDLFLFGEMVEEINRDLSYEYHFEMAHQGSVSGARGELAKGMVDAALLDLSLPDASGLESVRALEPYLLETPIIVLTGLDDHRIALAALRLGVQDYLVKGRISADLVVRSVRYAMERHRMTVMLKSAAFLDELTGLYNRRGFLQIADHQIRLSRRKGRGFSLTFVDLDGMKLINDRHGHPEGDAAIRHAAEILRSCFRDSDVIGRIGGDEFAALAIETDAEDEGPIRERLLGSIALHNRSSERPYELSMSVGVIHQEHDDEAPLLDLLSRADTLMYEQKRAKRAARENPGAG